MTMLDKIQGALTSLDIIGCRGFDEIEIAKVRLALVTAQQEAEAWRDINTWCSAKAGRYAQVAPQVPYVALMWRGIEQYESEVETEGENVILKAGAWCRTQVKP